MNKGESDPFLRGILQEQGNRSSRAVKIYQRLSSVGGEQGSGGSQDSGLPGRLLLERADQVPSLFDYQEELASAIEELARRKRNCRALVSLPTGAGKTRTAVSAILKLFAAGRISTVLWLAPTRELLDQAFDTFKYLWANYPKVPSIELVRCHELGEIPSSEVTSVYLMTPQMLVSRLKRSGQRWPSFDFVVFDEAHFAIAPTYSEALDKICSPKQGAMVPCVGLSATPGRADDELTEDLAELFENRLLTSAVLGKSPIDVLIERGMLAKVRFNKIELGEKLVGQSRTVERASQLGLGGADLDFDKVRFEATVTQIQGLPKENKVIVFAGSIAHANALCAVLLSRGLLSAVISSRTPIGLRVRILKEFKEGDLNVLINKSILATGYDCPAVSELVLATPIGSPILFEQMVGRVCRGPATGGGEEANVWQLDNHLAIHGVPSSYRRFVNLGW